MKEEYKKTVTCPICKYETILDKLGNYTEEYVQCTNLNCNQTFKNPYYDAGGENANPSYIG